MGTLARKRARADAAPLRAPKRRAPQDDSDIDSDDAGSVHSAPASPAASASSSASSLPDETPEQRRLRLAKAYLSQIGVSMDASAASSDEEDAEEDGDAVNKRLRDEALAATGKAVSYIADGFAARVQKATVCSARGHVRAPTCVAVGADGETAVSGGKDARVILWDVRAGRRKCILKATVDDRVKRDPARADGHVGDVCTVAMDQEGGMAVSGGSDGLIRVWDARVGKAVECLRGHRGAITGLAFRQGSRQLFSASADRTVKVWDMNDMAYVETLFGHGGEVNAVDSLAKERALSCGRDGTLRLYKIVEGSQLVFRRAMTVSIDVVAMLSEQRFVSGGDDGTVCLWQHSKKKPIAVMEKAHGPGLGCKAWVSAVAAFRNTDLVATGGGDGKLRFWKCENVPKIIQTAELDVGPGFVNGISTAPSHGVMALAVGNEHRLGRWERVRGARNTVQFVSIPSE